MSKDDTGQKKLLRQGTQAIASLLALHALLSSSNKHPNDVAKIACDVGESMLNEMEKRGMLP